MVQEGWEWCTPESVPKDGTVVTWGMQAVDGTHRAHGAIPLPTWCPVVQGTAPAEGAIGQGGGRGAGCWVLPIMLMEMDRCRKDTCAHVHVCGGGGGWLRVLAGP